MDALSRLDTGEMVFELNELESEDETQPEKRVNEEMESIREFEKRDRLHQSIMKRIQTGNWKKC